MYPCKFIIFKSYIYEGFPCGLVGKESVCNAREPGLIPGLGRPSEEGDGNPLQYSSLGNHRQRSLEGYSPWGHKSVM